MPMAFCRAYLAKSRYRQLAQPAPPADRTWARPQLQQWVLAPQVQPLRAQRLRAQPPYPISLSQRVPLPLILQLPVLAQVQVQRHAARKPLNHMQRYQPLISTNFGGLSGMCSYRLA